MKIFLFVLFSFSYHITFAQPNSRPTKRIISFYNCENFYDTIDQRNTIDEEFTPLSIKAYNGKIFEQKRKQIAQTIYELGKQVNQDGISIMGLVEIENKMVLDALVNDPIIKKYHYQIIHFDSKDLRGVDVALIYHPAHFKPYQYKPISLNMGTHQNDFPTRDILYVKGLLDHQWVHVLVNHWPSRRGGTKESAKRRYRASEVARTLIDSIVKTDDQAQVIMMGDFNDNPTDPSLRNIPLENPFFAIFKKGWGSLAFNDQWSLFDQILLSKPFFDPNRDLTYYKSIIYNKLNRTESTGKFKGYPKRTWSGDQYNKGFSDHFPVSIILNQKMAENPLK